jgi:transcriptional regulator with XRE-family HTH domain
VAQLIVSNGRTEPPAAVQLAKLRKARKLSQAELACRVGIKQAAIARIEGRSDILLSTLWRLISAMGGKLSIRAEFPDGTTQNLTEVVPHASSSPDQNLHGVKTVAIPPRRILNFGIPQAVDSTVLLKYMRFRYFESLIENRSLYLRRLDRFKDRLEGQPSQAEWDQTKDSEVARWYETNKLHSFITCFTVGDNEAESMWNEYVGADEGVVFKTTVGAVKAQLSRPGLSTHPELLSDEARAIQKRIPSVRISVVDERPSDAFTLGLVEYFDEGGTDLHSEMPKGSSDARHAFRKRRSWRNHKEFRVFLRPGSFTEESAFKEGREALYLPVDLAILIAEIRVKPGSSDASRERVKSLLRDNGLGHIPVNRSQLGI